MRKVLKTRKNSQRSGVGILAALTLSLSLAAFGCSTNHYPGNGEPSMDPTTSTPTSTPGTSSGTTGVPQTMVSAAPDRPSSTDAIAILRANEAYRGKILGPAAPATGVQPNASLEQVTGQFVSPSQYANPQITVNSSVSSPGLPAVTSGAGTATAVIAVPGSTTSALATAAATNTALASNSITAATNVAGGTTPVIATPITNTRTATSATAPVRIVNSASGVTVTNQTTRVTARVQGVMPTASTSATTTTPTVQPITASGPKQ